MLDLLVHKTQPTKRRRTSGLNTTTLRANKRVNTQDIDSHSHQPTTRLTWEEERVSGPDRNLKIDGVQSFQTNAEKWAQSEATEINSLIQSGAFSPVYNGPVQSELNESSSTSTRVSMRFAPKPISKPISSISHSQRHYTNNFVATWNMDANENYSD